MTETTRFIALLKAELKALFTNPVVLLTVFGGVVFYSFLYPLPYTQQTPREQTLSIVNLDKSQASYQLERMVDATPQVKVIQRDSTIEDAKQAFLNRKVSGILVIPEHFYKDLLLGKSPTLAYAGDASYFLVYGTIVEGLSQAGGTLAAKSKVSRLVMEGEPLSLAAQHYSATSINLKPTFNPRMGYVDYVVPAVFVLILQQTMIMAAGLMGGTQKHGNGYWSHTTPLRLILVRSIVLVAVYYLLSMYYFGASFTSHGVNTLASAGHLLLLLLPFLLASCLCGIWLGSVTPRRELVTLVVLISSMPLIFSAGFIWPLEAIPRPIIWISNLFPSTPAIQGFLSLNQMGASWDQISTQWGILWVQVFGWGALAFYQLQRKR
ncbi:ABC transporter permease [Vibrio anguillarum]|jgi:ABC-2 type transport system permease protein|uniref:ABC transporter permease n=1 Tax=Vibrio anguillarum TaxID=55601 RepID=A0ABR9Z186_VIBAN|nr:MULTISPECIES: ABC transporter permease [Vibrio]MBF4243631.1 ABC transporter permease [Vibrio anguillarum]MBF4256938.1 ABC transporter permease [Vibrio anguillarum]MBF4278321.1 ABC transporter permease [Vibrio anguillarum]MBF4298694.1 ABC transporter permease [Vibrio anguillarum]MBF4362759.1 ABC transporter permease [Vibrio anguillarum]